MPRPDAICDAADSTPGQWRRLDPNGLQHDGDYVRRLLITLAVLGLAYIGWLVSGVLLLAFASVLLAVLLRGFADLIAGYTPIPRRWTLTTAIIVAALVLAGFLALFGTQIGGQISQLSESLPPALDAAGNRIGISNASGKLQDALVAGSGSGVLSRAVGLGYTVLGALADLVLVAVAAIYLASDPRLYRRGAVKLLPPSQHRRIFDAMDVTGRALQLWFGGQLVTMTLVGSLTALAFWWIGLPSPLALGLIAGVTNFIPFLGPILGTIPALVFAVTMDLATVLWTLGAILVIQQLEGNVITPFIQQRAVAMPPALVLFAIVAFGVVFGWLGVFLAVPLAVATTVLVKKLWIRQTLGEQTTVPGEGQAGPGDQARPGAAPMPPSKGQ